MSQTILFTLLCPMWGPVKSWESCTNINHLQRWFSAPTRKIVSICQTVSSEVSWLIIIVHQSVWYCWSVISCATYVTNSLIYSLDLIYSNQGEVSFRLDVGQTLSLDPAASVCPGVGSQRTLADVWNTEVSLRVRQWITVWLKQSSCYFQYLPAGLTLLVKIMETNVHVIIFYFHF